MYHFFTQYISKPLRYVAVFLTCAYFWHAIVYIYEFFSNPVYYDKAFVFLILITLVVFQLYRFRKQFRTPTSLKDIRFPLILLITLVLGEFANGFTMNLEIASSILFLSSLYAIIGFYLSQQLWLKLGYLWGIFILTLPIVERAERFLGLPLRIFTAEAVSFIFSFFHISQVSQSTIILTESRIVSVDIPCSGIKSLYIGFMFVLVLFYFEKLRWNIHSFIRVIIFFILLIGFNIWRVFILTYLYGYLDMKDAADAVHVIIGLIGFGVSCLVFFIRNTSLSQSHSATAKRVNSNNLPTKNPRNTFSIYEILPSVILIIALIVATIPNTLLPHTPTSEIQITKKFSMSSAQLKQIPLLPAEEQFFQSGEVMYVSKQQGIYSEGDIPFSLTLVSSSSSRFQHNPDVCLQTLGHVVVDEELVTSSTSGNTFRRLSLNQGNEHVYYWFVSGEDVITDYAERMWEDLTGSERVWTLVIVGIEEENQHIVPKLFEDVNSEMQVFFL